MASKNQCSDYAQKGPGVGRTSFNSFMPSVAPSISPSGNSRSGSSQSDKRGKQGG